jgi:lipopolysaccharide export system permease protein
MTIISWYLTRTYLSLSGTCLTAFSAIYLVIDFLEKIGRFSRSGAPGGALAAYFACKLPEIVTQVTPLALLMGTLLTMGVLARQSEITAMRSCGVSLLQIGRPLCLTAALISLLLIGAGELLVPAANDKARYLEEVVIGHKNPNTFFRQYNIWYRDEHTILQAKLFDPGKQLLHGITLWQTDANLAPTSRIIAASAAATSGGWLLRQVTAERLLNGVVAESAHYQELPVTLNLKVADLKVIEKSADNMGIRALYRYCTKLEKGGYDTTRCEALLQAKLSMPFATLIMTFLGVPFALRGGRSGGVAIGIGISLGIGFAYFVINATLLSFGQAGVLPPLVAAWAANCIFAALGLWLALTAEG